MQKPLLAALALLLPASCGGGGDAPGESDERGGPHALAGFTWSAEPAVVGGIELAFALRFDDDSVTAQNTCDGALTASVTAPVRYLYSATIPEGDSVEESRDGATCQAGVEAGTFDFEIVDGRLEMLYEGELVVFEPAGAVAGLYGSWRAEAPGIGTLTWSMGGGAIEVEAACENGLSARVVVDAEFENRVQFPEAAEDVVSDDFGAECSVAIATGEAEYHFEGDTLVMTFDGQDLYLEPRR